MKSNIPQWQRQTGILTNVDRPVLSNMAVALDVCAVFGWCVGSGDEVIFVSFSFWLVCLLGHIWSFSQQSWYDDDNDTSNSDNRKNNTLRDVMYINLGDFHNRGRMLACLAEHLREKVTFVRVRRNRYDSVRSFVQQFKTPCIMDDWFISDSVGGATQGEEKEKNAPYCWHVLQRRSCGFASVEQRRVGRQTYYPREGGGRTTMTVADNNDNSKITWSDLQELKTRDWPTPRRSIRGISRKGGQWEKSCLTNATLWIVPIS